MGEIIKIPRSVTIRRQLKEAERHGAEIYVQTDIGFRIARLVVCKDAYFEFTTAGGQRTVCWYGDVERVSTAIKKEGRVIALQQHRLRGHTTVKLVGRSDNST
jgi:hypothetical protein